MKKFKYVIIISLILFSCGFEDSVYFMEPSNIHLENSGTDQVKILFKGYNQEMDNIYYLLIGYDVYYYFDKEENAKKMVVRNPYISKNSKLLDLSNDQYPPNPPDSPYRFPKTTFPHMEEFYKTTTIPVSLEMIKDVLTDKNDNVRFCFHNDPINDNTTDKNPYKDPANSFIFMEELYPNPSEYENASWLDEINDGVFKGFYDKRYYDNKGISYITEESNPPLYYIYKMYVYIIAKGYNSGAEIDRNPSFIESVKSNIIEVKLRVTP
ncbi:MAG TPA: hypothetical protein PLE45_10420 [Spirochaetota bacterium]|nr:hypothetical protein [Spirochaetota bacterium]HOL57569.1 hypothetical protein [Spirochaetota bacterium]HPP05119.1 hypothetical protein [Spirochaetota bacterium]